MYSFGAFERKIVDGKQSLIMNLLMMIPSSSIISRYYQLEDGRIIRETKSSYEDSTWKITDIYSVCLSKNTLIRMADLAIRKINNFNIPISDIDELKKKIISYINGIEINESSGEYLMTIAGLLGLDFEDGINF